MSAVLIADLVVVGLLAYCVWRGMRHGALVSFLSMAGVLCGYAGAIFLGRLAGQPLVTLFDLAGLYARVLGSVLVFIVVSGLFRLGIKRILRRRASDRDQTNRPLSSQSRLIGALLGILIGIVVIVLLHWLYSLMRGTERGGHLPDLHRSVGSGISRNVVGRTARLVMNDNAAHLVSQPDETIRLFRDILAEECVVALLQDAPFKEALLAGDAEAIRLNPAYQRVFEVQSAAAKLKAIGLIGEDAEASKKTMADALAKAGAQMGGLLDDPEVSSRIESLREDGLLEKEAWHKLLFDNRFIYIMERVMSRSGTEN
ncbi:MAG: CvpA family protein [Candidatus Marinimicrobia bacterium]|nr:CvpA family protein [Candidatus Neomarinimicrobiota bacterium]